jgi:hypothetical protein
MSNLFGYPFRGKVEDLATDMKLGREYVTVTQAGNSKVGLDVISRGMYMVGAADRVVGLASTDVRLVLVGHDILEGDLIQLKTTANNIKETEISVKRVINANTVELAGVLSASLTAGDTFDILRAVVSRYDADGNLSVSVVPTPIAIEVTNGAVTTQEYIKEDLDTPGNTVPMPVRIYGFSDSISITADEINVQLTHSGGTPDSVRIGDGTELLAINAANEATVHDADVLTQVTALNAKDYATQTTLAALNAKFASLGQKNMAGSVPVALASDQGALTVSDITGTVSLPTGAATAAKQDTIISAIGTTNAKDFATETTLTALNTKISSLGRKVSASSTPVVLSTEQEAILNGIGTSLSTLDDAVSGSEMQVDLVSIGPAATEATLASVNNKLPVTLGQKNSAGSVSVVIASDQSKVNTTLSIVDFLDAGLLDAGTTNIPTTGVTVVASLAADVKKIQIIDTIGEFMSLRNGAGSVLAYLPLGGGEVEVSIASGTELKLYSEKGSTISSNHIAINFQG